MVPARRGSHPLPEAARESILGRGREFGRGYVRGPQLWPARQLPARRWEGADQPAGGERDIEACSGPMLSEHDVRLTQAGPAHEARGLHVDLLVRLSPRRGLARDGAARHGAAPTFL